jgi:hypothetical protein
MTTSRLAACDPSQWVQSLITINVQVNQETHRYAFTKKILQGGLSTVTAVTCITACGSEILKLIVDFSCHATGKAIGGVQYMTNPAWLDRFYQTVSSRPSLSYRVERIVGQAFGLLISTCGTFFLLFLRDDWAVQQHQSLGNYTPAIPKPAEQASAASSDSVEPPPVPPRKKNEGVSSSIPTYTSVPAPTVVKEPTSAAPSRSTEPPPVPPRKENEEDSSPVPPSTTVPAPLPAIVKEPASAVSPRSTEPPSVPPLEEKDPFTSLSSTAPVPPPAPPGPSSSKPPSAPSSSPTPIAVAKAPRKNFLEEITAKGGKDRKAFTFKKGAIKSSSTMQKNIGGEIDRRMKPLRKQSEVVSFLGIADGYTVKGRATLREAADLLDIDFPVEEEKDLDGKLSDFIQDLSTGPLKQGEIFEIQNADYPDRSFTIQISKIENNTVIETKIKYLIPDKSKDEKKP